MRISDWSSDVCSSDLVRLGDCMGSCTFAGMRRPERAERLLGPAQVIGIFAFQAALRMLRQTRLSLPLPRLHPRPRDCVMLAGCGYSNKQISRALGLTRSEEPTSELQSPMRTSYAVF